jgi:mono/diheme cytochrome c family protein
MEHAELSGRVGWRLARLAAVSGLAGLLALPALAAEPTNVVEAGKARYLDFCAVCHGADAKGGGVFKAMLNKPPVDLTTLSKNNNGSFPFGRVYDQIDGRDMPGAHGTVEMPIWGGTWRTDSALGAETEIRGRILEIIVYLRSIQQ